MLTLKMSDLSAATQDYRSTPPHPVSVVLGTEPGASHALGRHSTRELQLQQKRSFLKRRHSKCDNIFESIRLISQGRGKPTLSARIGYYLAQITK